MATKKTSKKPSSKRAKSESISPFMPSSSSIDVQKADNGFIVSSFGPKGSKRFIAKDKKEAKSFANKLMGF